MLLGLQTGTWRMLIAFGGLIFFAILELKHPFRKPVTPVRKHYLINLVLGAFNGFLLNIGFTSLVVAYYHMLSERGIGLLNLLHLKPWANVAASFIFLDFITYLWHRAYHEFPLLWRLHRVHHSDPDLDVTSASRFHLGEIVFSSLFKMAIGFLWGPSALALAFHEAGLLFAAQFHHANIRLPQHWEPKVRKIFVTPDMHRVHHSDLTENTNSNYSNLFSFWDRLLGTNVHYPQEKIIIGLKEYARPADVTFPKLLAMPFYG